jgi:hypothetical protein
MKARFGVGFCLAVGCLAIACNGQQVDAQKASGASMPGGMAHMSGHMYMTTLRAIQPGDKEKADAIVTAAKEALAVYQDCRIFRNRNITSRITKTDARQRRTSIR